MKKLISIVLVLLMVISICCTMDISYSLERYNLIRRAYWVNGHREKANSLYDTLKKSRGYLPFNDFII